MLRHSRAPLLFVDIADPTRLSEEETRTLLKALYDAGTVGYRTTPDPGADGILALGAQLGLTRLNRHQCAEPDGVARLTARTDTARRFIPYTRQRLRWHTDGYYQPAEQGVRSFILHCVRPALAGGINYLLDPRLLYIALRDENPDWIRALSHPQALTVPAHIHDGQVRRPEFQGPVFALDEGHLHTRYTERAEHIRWRPETTPARRHIHKLLEALPSARIPLRLQPGWGLIAHNVLHCRSAYADHPEHPRLLYRARYLDRAHRPC